ncbi:MgtC/SapB family protein [Candidatus Pacearchaeota archaeon]|nr:MgtC/SapB family protein [Candidatus Pacearchaeota archaeon]
MLIDYESIIKIVLAVIIGTVIGYERKKAGKPIGSRTLALVCVSTAFIVILGQTYIPLEIGRVLQGILTGLGFLGAGAIIAHGKNIIGLTTAATIWSIAILGIAIGFGEYILTAIVAIIIFTLLTLGKVHTK